MQTLRGFKKIGEKFKIIVKNTLQKNSFHSYSKPTGLLRGVPFVEGRSAQVGEDFKSFSGRKKCTSKNLIKIIRVGTL